jgi:hypothetical protein
MPPLALFQISIAFSLIAWGIVLARYLLPELRRQSRAGAMQPLILLHCFRFVGLSFLVPGVVSPDLPPAWAVPPPTAISLPRCWLCWRWRGLRAGRE